MFKFYFSVLHKSILLNLAFLLFSSLFTHAANEGREYTSDDQDQLHDENTFISSEHQVRPSGSGRTRSYRKADSPIYLSLKLSEFKISLIEQKENKLKNNQNHSAEFPWKSGHIWNLSELSDTEALNLCYTLWLGLSFEDIEELDTTDLPPKLHSYCNKIKKYPVEDTEQVGRCRFSFSIVYPYTELLIKSISHPISVLQCFCRFTHSLNSRFISNNSNRKFLAHKLNDNEYLILSPVSKEHHKHQHLKIIDIQEVDPTTVHLGDKRRIPTYTGAVDQSSSTNNESEATPSGSQSGERNERADHPMYLSLTVSRRKTDLIIQKEYEMKNNFDDSAAFPKQSGHHWNFFNLSENKAKNLCYSLWLGFTFSDIDEIDKTELPPLLYPYCTSKKVPIGENGELGAPNSSYNIVYPYMEINLETRHYIDVLECICRFTSLPKGSRVSHNSNRKFFAYCYKRNEYLVLSPISKDQYMPPDLRIIDVQKVDPALLHFGDKTITPIFTTN